MAPTWSVVFLLEREARLTSTFPSSTVFRMYVTPFLAAIQVVFMGVEEYETLKLSSFTLFGV
jgi:hypothetical protein